MFNWDVSIGDIVSIFAFIVTLWAFHQTNVRRIIDSETRLSQIETKINLIYSAIRIRFNSHNDEE